MDNFEMIQKVIDIIEENIGKKIKLPDLASAAHCSEAHFGRIFYSIIGVNVMEYVRGRKLSLAANELRLTPLKIIDASYKFGYESPESFTKAYKKFHGHPPSKTRGALQINYQERAFPMITKYKMMEGAVIMSKFGSPLPQINEELDRQSANLFFCINTDKERFAVKAVDVCEIASLKGLYLNAKWHLFRSLRKKDIPVARLCSGKLNQGEHNILICIPVKGRDLSETSNHFFGLIINGNPMLKLAKSVKSAKNTLWPFTPNIAKFNDEELPCIDMPALHSYVKEQLTENFEKKSSILYDEADDSDVIKKLEYMAYDMELLARNASIEAARGMQHHKGTMVIAYELHQHALEIAKIAHSIRERYA